MPEYRRFFNHIKVLLTQEELSALEALSTQSLLSSAVAEVTIIAPIFNDSPWERPRKPKRAVTWEIEGAQWTREQCESNDTGHLRATFALLLTESFSRFTSLRDVSLEAAALRNARLGEFDRECWPRAFLTAAQAYRVVMDAISSATHDISSLRIFTNTGACSVVSLVLAEPISDTQPYLSLKSLGLSFSANIRNRPSGKDDPSMLVRTRGEIDEASRRMFSEKSKTGKRNGGNGMALQLLRHCNNLEKLDLHFCHVPVPELEQEQYAEDFARMVKGTSLRDLKYVAIRGLYVKEPSLLQFLQKSPNIQKLKADYVHLTKGQWQPVISHLYEMLQLEEVKLGSLMQHGSMVDLTFEGEEDEEEDSIHHIDFLHETLLNARTLRKDDLSRNLVLAAQKDCFFGSPEVSRSSHYRTTSIHRDYYLFRTSDGHNTYAPHRHCCRGH